MSDLHQQLVPSGVAQTVIDHLEAVQVDEQHGQLLTVSLAAGNRVTDPIEEERAIREAGERVVERAVAELLLEVFAFGSASKGARGVLGQLAGAAIFEGAEPARVEDAANHAYDGLVGAIVERNAEARAVRGDCDPIMLVVVGRPPLDEGADHLSARGGAERLLIDEGYLAVRTLPPETGRIGIEQACRVGQK